MWSAELSACECRTPHFSLYTPAMWPFGKAKPETEANKSVRAGLLWKQGNRYLSRDRFDRAIASYEEAYALEPSLLEGRLNFGAALYLSKRPAEALPHLQYVLALEPQNTAALLNIAAVYDALGRLDESVAALEKLVGARPNWADANYNLAIAYVKQARFDDATLALRRELTLNPKHEAARTLLNEVHLKPRRSAEPFYTEEQLDGRADADLVLGEAVVNERENSALEERAEDDANADSQDISGHERDASGEPGVPNDGSEGENGAER